MGLLGTIGSIAGTVFGGPIGSAIGGAIGGELDKEMGGAQEGGAQGGIEDMNPMQLLQQLLGGLVLPGADSKPSDSPISLSSFPMPDFNGGERPE
jgi:hypothetical protein